MSEKSNWDWEPGGRQVADTLQWDKAYNWVEELHASPDTLIIGLETPYPVRLNAPQVCGNEHLGADAGVFWRRAHFYKHLFHKVLENVPGDVNYLVCFHLHQAAS